MREEVTSNKNEMENAGSMQPGSSQSVKIAGRLFASFFEVLRLRFKNGHSYLPVHSPSKTSKKKFRSDMNTISLKNVLTPETLQYQQFPVEIAAARLLARGSLR
jgi:hypothetical protein